MNPNQLRKNLCFSGPEVKPEHGKRILWIGDDGLTATIPLEGRFAWAGLESTATLLQSIKAGEFKTYRFSALWGLPPAKEKSLLALEKAWSFISELTELHQPIVNLRALNKQIPLIALKHGVLPAKADRWIRRWWQNGQSKPGLRPQSGKAGTKKRTDRKVTVPILGRPPRIEIATDVRRNLVEGDYEKFEQKIWLFHRGNDKDTSTLRKTYDTIVAKEYPQSLLSLEDRKVGFDCSAPTYAQFLRYYYSAWPSKPSRTKAKCTSVQFETRHRKALGSTRHHILGPGRQYQLDSTPLSLHTLDAGRERYVGRAVLYLVVDVATSYIVSWWLSLEHASYLVACIALLGCLENRREFNERIGIEYDPRFPEYFGLCDVLRVDNQEFLTHAGQRVTDLGIQPSFARINRGDDKASVESCIGLSDKILRCLPGGIKIDPSRGAPDVRRRSFLNIHDLRKIVGRRIDALNRRFLPKFPRLPWMIEDEVFPRPYLMWEAGLARFGNSMLALDYKEAAWSLLPKAKTASSDRRGVHVQAGRCSDMRYLLPAGSNPDLCFDGNRIPVEVRYDPKLVDYVYLREQGQTQILTCELAPHSSGFRGMTWNDVGDELLKVASHRAETSLRDRQDNAKTSEADCQTIMEAKAASSKGSSSHTALARGTKDARDADTRRLRAQEPIIRPVSSAPLVNLHRRFQTISLEDDYAAIERQLQGP